MRGDEQDHADNKVRWLAGCAALAIGASLGWTLADLVSSPSASEPTRELPPEILPRLNRKPPHPVMPESLGEPSCRFPVVEGRPALRLSEVATGLANPTFVTSPPDDSRLFVTEAAGRIVIIEEGRATNPPFLDLSEIVTTRARLSQRLGGLGTLAFHPRYQQTGRFFVSYIDEGRGISRIVEVHVSRDPDRADPSSLFPLLEVALPSQGEAPAMLAFGPDGYLYIGLGDGGERGDPRHLSQRTDSLLGKILRLDVDRADRTTPYALPAGNRQGPRVLGEIWALGVHRPTRFGFDRHSFDLWLGEVGEEAIDEIDVLPFGESELNLGWSFLEGSQCVATRECDSEGLLPPFVELRRDDKECELVGGYVYRGCRMPDLAGEYFFGDRCGQIRSIQPLEDDTRQRIHDRFELPRVPGLVSFGEDAQGELYVVSSRGKLFRIEPKN